MGIDENEEKFAWKKAVNLLSRRAYFSTELRQKLETAGFSSDIVDAVITKCRQAGYIDDEERARRMVEMWERKGYGPARIRLELQKRGVKASIPIANNAQYISRYIEKHLPATPTQQQKAKIIRALLRRGFSHEMIYTALQECLT